MKGAPAAAQEAVDEDETTLDEQQDGLALAVDLEKWKLGKPVIQKSGAFQLTSLF